MQRFAAAAAGCHQQADLGESRLGEIAELCDRLHHVAQTHATVARLVPGDDVVDAADHRFGMPLRGASVTVVQWDLAANNGSWK